MKIINLFTGIVNSLYNSRLKNKKSNEIISQRRDTLLPKLMNNEIKL